MTKDEFLIVAKGLKAVYASQNFMPDKDSFDVWYAMLQDLPYDLVSATAQQYMLTNKFPPTIADLRSKATDLVAPQELNEMQAWDMVSKAIRDSAYHAKERFEAFPETVQKAVGSPETLRTWGMSTDFNENVAQSHFISTYRTIVKREKEFQALPANMQKALKSIQMGSQKMIGGATDA